MKQFIDPPEIEHFQVTTVSAVDKKLSLSDLSADQSKAMHDVVDLLCSAQPRPVVSLGGYAGTGKSTLIPFISRALGDTSSTAFCALAGKAANVMKLKLRAADVHHYAHCGTIHSLIYRPMLDAKGRICGWARNSELKTRDGEHIRRIVIDEASMVGTNLLQDLMSYGVPILCVGDPGQLPPVQDTSTVKDPDVLLKAIHRQAANNPIIALAHQIREGGDIPKAFKSCPEVQLIKEADLMPVVSDGFVRLGMDFGILVRTNKTRAYLNSLGHGSIPKVGDIVICLKNVPPVYNGMRGTIEKLERVRHWYKTTILLADEGLKITGMIPASQFGSTQTFQTLSDAKIPSGKLGMLFDFGSALTVHKAQGSAFDECVLIPERWSSDNQEDYARWLYTGVTRAANKLTIVSQR